MKFLTALITKLNKKKNILPVLVFILFAYASTTVNAQRIGESVQNFIKSSKIPKEMKDARVAALSDCTSGSLSRNTWIGGINAKCSNGAEVRPGVIGDVLQALTDYASAAPGSVSTLTSQGETVTLSWGGGATYKLSSLTAQVIGTKPASSTEYVADVMQTITNPFGVQKAYAQGLGFSSLRPVLELWKVFRNIAYFFFVVIFLITGFLIMFRSKIGGQAAVTVQQALPKIVVSLLLVTFSYAIAGLMVDVMYLIIYMIVGIFTPYFGSGIDTGSGAISLTDIAFKNNIVQNIFGLLSTGVVGNVSGALGNIVVGALGLTEQEIVGAGLQNISNILFTLILAIVVLVSLFRIFMALIQAYIGIFFSVIFGPIQLLIGALPGQNTFGTWIKGLLENLMVFPTIVLLIFIAYFFTVGPFGVEDTNSENANLGFSAPQLTSNQSADGFSVYQSLLALGAILAMPEALKVAKGLMKGQLDVNVGDLAKNFKQGVPLGTRLALGGIPALGSGLGKGWGAFSDGASLGDSFGAFTRGIREAPKNSRLTKWGMGGANLISKATGSNQPDYLNAITNRMDQWSNPKSAEEQRQIQLFEAALKANREALGTTGTPTPKK